MTFLISKLEKESLTKHWLNHQLLVSFRPKTLIMKALNISFPTLTILHLLKPGDLLVVQISNWLKYYELSSGICLSKHMKGLNTSFSFKTLILRIPLEKKFLLFSPLILSLHILTPKKQEQNWSTFYWRDRKNVRRQLLYIRKFGTRRLKSKTRVITQWVSK